MPDKKPELLALVEVVLDFTGEVEGLIAGRVVGTLGRTAGRVTDRTVYDREDIEELRKPPRASEGVVSNTNAEAAIASPRKSVLYIELYLFCLLCFEVTAF